MLIEGFPLWVAQTNGYIVAAEPGAEAVIIDVPPDPAAVLARCQHWGVTPVAVLATHGHIDHVGGIGTFVRDADPAMPVHIHPGDRHMLDDPVRASGGMAAYLESLDLDPPEVISGLDDGDIVKGAGLQFTVIHTPGHTKGSVCFLLETIDGTVLFSGDHLFRDSVGRTDLPGGSWEELMESMRSKILPLDDAIAVLPGHGPSTTIGRERQVNPFVLEALAGGFGGGAAPHRG